MNFFPKVQADSTCFFNTVTAISRTSVSAEAAAFRRVNFSSPQLFDFSHFKLRFESVQTANSIPENRALVFVSYSSIRLDSNNSML